MWNDMPPVRQGDSPEAMLQEACAQPLHYLQQGKLLHALHREHGYPLAVLCSRTGLSAEAVLGRISLMQLDEALHAQLMATGAPEAIALMLLKLPDEVTRRRIARRVLRERLCIRDARLLVEAALQHMPPIARQTEAIREVPNALVTRGRVINLVRDPRPYINALRDIAGQMQQAGVHAALTEQRQGGLWEITISVPVRRRRANRRQGR